MSSPGDNVARERIRTELDRSFAVRAGAGAGKTTLLVERLAALGSSVGWDGIAAVTFTEAAAAEMTNRLRDRVGDAARQVAVETLHAFSIRLLRRWGVRIGMPPAFRLLTGEKETERRDDWWDRLIERHGRDLEAREEWRTALRSGFGEADARAYCDELDANWDRLVLPAGMVLEPSVFGERDVRAYLAGHLDVEIPGMPTWDAMRETLVAALIQGTSIDLVFDDKLATQIVRIVNRASLWRLEWDDDMATAWPTSDFPAPNVGTVGFWGSPDGLAILKELRRSLNDALKHEVEGFSRYAKIRPLLVRLTHETLREARKRRADGEPNFHDVLVGARDLLRDPTTARDVATAFPRILVDEAQDVDPIQREIAHSIVTAAGDKNTVFVVGDPQQSIYGFRRADPAILDDLHSGEAPLVSETLTLDTNFRSSPEVLKWVNAHFARILDERVQGRPFQSLRVSEGKPPGAVWPIRVEVDRSRGEGNHELIGQATARAIKRLSQGEGVALRDIALLLPTRTGLPALEKHLSALCVPYRLEAGSLIVSSRECRELRALARALDDPTDAISVVAALRGSTLAVSDEELKTYALAYKHAHSDRDLGSMWNYEDAAAGKAGGPAGDALRRLRQWYRDIERGFREGGVHGALSRLIDASRYREMLALDPRPRDAWRRVEFLLAQAQAYDTEGGNLFGFLASMDRREADETRDVWTPAEEIDDDAVRVMTIHAAKGLEFPAVILTGTGAMPTGRGAPGTHITSEAIEVNVGGARSLGYSPVQKLKAHAEYAERARLFYVAATRAKRFFVPVLPVMTRDDSKKYAAWRDKSSETEHAWIALAKTLEREGGWVDLPADDAPLPEPDVAPDVIPSPEVWNAETRAILDRAEFRRASATSLSASQSRDQSQDADQDSTSRAPGRLGIGGAALGRAAHNVLQAIALPSGEGLESAVTVHATEEDVDPRRVTRLVTRALDWIRENVKGPYRREIFLSACVDDILVEGYLDLVAGPADDLSIIDWKTNSVRGPEDVAAAMVKYRLQAGVYAMMCRRTVGRAPREMTFVYLEALPEPWAVARVAVDDALISDAEAAVRAGYRPPPESEDADVGTVSS